MDLETRSDMGVKFLRTQYEGRKVSLARATITDRGKRTQTFHEGKARLTLRPSGMGLEGHVRSMIKRSDSGEEIFYAPTPMAGQKGRKKEQALPNVVVFGDADNGLTADVKARLTELGACLVRSGGHVNNDSSRPKYHVYLLLTKEVPPAELERLNRGLKAFIQGDKFDATTLLRIPGTRNHKYPGSPIVRVERYADARHTPENLAKFLDAPSNDSPASTASGVELPEVPKGFTGRGKKEYEWMRKEVRIWNTRFNDPHQHMRRYTAAIAIVKEAVKRGLTIHEAYAFALTCEALMDKQEEENGYSIQKDVAKIWRRETGIKPSGTLTADDILSAHQTDDARNKTRTTPADDSSGSVVEAIPPKTPDHIGDGPNPYSTRGASRRYLDMALFTSGNFKPPEPEFFSVEGSFHLLYRGMTHCIFGDSGSGKTWIVLAQIAKELLLGKRVKYIDFENGAMTIGHRLRNVLGVPGELLTPDHFAYMSFTEMPDSAEIEDEAEEAHDLVIIDGVDASLAMFQKAMNSATEVREWYDYFPQKYAEKGSTVCLIDHTSKGNRDKVDPRHQEPGGSPAKLAVLTGAAYYVKPEDNRELVPGQRGVVQAYITRKDKDGFLKSRARKDGHLFNFIIDTVDGETAVEFESAKEISEPVNAGPKLNDDDRTVLVALAEAAAPLNISRIREITKIQGQRATQAVSNLVSMGYAYQETGRGNAKPTAITSAGRDFLAGKAEPIIEGEGSHRRVDFERVPEREDWQIKKEGKGRRECRKCREHILVIELAQPDDIGYTPGRPMCKPCAAEPIDVETQWAQDGPERARRIRESIERERDTHEDD